MRGFDPEEAHELVARLGRAGIRLRVCENELIAEGAGLGAHADVLRRRKWDLVRTLRGENVRGLRFAADGRSYRVRMTPPLPKPPPEVADGPGDLDC